MVIRMVMAIKHNRYGFGKAFLAKYTVYDDIEEYQNNPLIEALPPISTEDELIEMISTPVMYKPEERNLSPEIRGHLVERLFRIFEPLEKHLELNDKLSRVIRQGYLDRNPLLAEYATMLHENYRIIRNGEYEIPVTEEVGSGALGFGIIGYSGVGKSRGIEKILSLYPQLLVHSEYKGQELSLYQLTWLKLDCPYDGSPRGLCVNFFQQVDKILGSDYEQRFVKPRASTNDLLGHMAQISYLHCLGVLVVDEIQHLNVAKSGGSDKILNFLVTMVNTIGVPVVLIGTNAALSVLQGQFRQGRRGTGQGHMYWDRMHEDDLWDVFVEGIWNYQWTTDFTPLTDELKHALYDESQGIIDIAIKIFAISQWELISLGRGMITPSLISKVVKTNLKIIEPMLKALRSGDIKLLEKYEDIKPIDIDSIKESYISRMKNNTAILERKGKTKTDQDMMLDQIVSRLLGVGIEASLAKEAARQVLADSNDVNNPDQIANRATALAFSLQAMSTEVQSQEKQRGSKCDEFDEKDLRTANKRAKSSNKDLVEMLVEEEVISKPEDELF